MRGLVVGLGLLVGCGGQDWNGRYTGPTTDTGSCSDGSGGVNHESDGLTLTQSGDEVLFPSDCGVTVHAKIHGNAASIVPTDCPQTTANGEIVNRSYTEGVLKLSGCGASEGV